MSLNNYLKNKIIKIKEQLLYRKTIIQRRYSDNIILRNNKEYISFSCSDYLNLSFNKKIQNNSKLLLNNHKAIGSVASNLVTGYSDLDKKLEDLLCDIYSYESACIFGSGYLANIGVIPILVNKDDIVIADKYIHACIIDGIKLSGAKLIRYHHNKLDSLEDKLSKFRHKYNKCLVITEKVFSMHGTLSNIKNISGIAKKYDSWLMVDNAHSLSFDNHDSKYIDVFMGTFSKAVASYGGYILGSKELIDYIHNVCRSYIYSTSLPKNIICNSIASLEYIISNRDILRIAIDNAKFFCNIMNIKFSGSNIVFIEMQDNEQALNIANILLDNLYIVVAMRSPTVPRAGLRLNFNCSHKKEDINNIANIIRYNQ